VAVADAHELYGLPLEEFTAARNALAKQLTREGDKAAAEEVKRLPKPSKTAWALNQVARRQPEDVEQLLAAGERLREAQQRALAGDASRLRSATRAEQDQVDRLLDAAAALAGGGAVARDRLRNTLRAAATDPATGGLLREGRLVADVEPSGFGLDGLPDAVPDLPDLVPADLPADRVEEQAAPRARRQAHRDAQREAERLRRDAERQRDRAMRLMELAEGAERRAREARAQADAAAEAAEEAERRAVDAAGQAASLEPR
jgi:hypothetical protein